MRLIRFGAERNEKPGVMSADGKHDALSGYFREWDAHFFENAGLEQLSPLLSSKPSKAFPMVPASERWGAPVARPGKIICIGLNYSDHAKESGMAIPAEPVIFMKGANTVIGPYDHILIPRKSKKTDWEVELGVII